MLGEATKSLLCMLYYKSLDSPASRILNCAITLKSRMAKREIHILRILICWDKALRSCGIELHYTNKLSGNRTIHGALNNSTIRRRRCDDCTSALVTNRYTGPFTESPGNSTGPKL